MREPDADLTGNGLEGVSLGRTEIALVDGNYPAQEHARRLIRADGHGVLDLLAAILPLMPLDDQVEADIRAVVEAAGDAAIVKVILENAYLTKDEIVQLVKNGFEVAWIGATRRGEYLAQVDAVLGKAAA